MSNTGGAAFGTEGAPEPLGLVAARILNAFFGLLGIIFVVLFVYAGYMYMTAQGEEQKIDKAKKTMSSAVIGLIIVLMSYAIARFVTFRLQMATGAF